MFSIIINLSTDKIEVIKTWHGNKNKSILLALPAAMSKKYHLDEPSYLILEPMKEGIFLRKFEETKA
jgi:hypothetical protein